MLRFEDSYGEWYEYRMIGGFVECQSRMSPAWYKTSYFKDLSDVDYYWKSIPGFKRTESGHEFSGGLPVDKPDHGNVFDYGYGMSTTSAQKHKCTCLWATVWARGCQCNGA